VRSMSVGGKKIVADIDGGERRITEKKTKTTSRGKTSWTLRQRKGPFVLISSGKNEKRQYQNRCMHPKRGKMSCGIIVTERKGRIPLKEKQQGERLRGNTIGEKKPRRSRKREDVTSVGNGSEK